MTDSWTSPSTDSLASVVDENIPHSVNPVNSLYFIVSFPLLGVDVSTLSLLITDSTGFYFHPNGPVFLFTGITKIVFNVRLMFPHVSYLGGGGGAYKS